MDSKISTALNPLSISIEQDEYKDKKRYRFKIIILGDGNVGKSSILYQYTHKQDPSFQSPTIGADFSNKVIHYNDIQIHVQLWDTAGNPKNQAFPKNMHNGTVGVILVYDVSNKNSFKKIQDLWIDLVDKGQKNKQIFLVGNIKLNHENQMQKQRQVQFNDGQMFSKRRKIQFKEIAACKNNKVHELFHDIIKGILYKVENQIIPQDLVLYGVSNGAKSLKLSNRDILSERRYNRCC